MEVIAEPPSTTSVSPRPRNPGPSWGYPFLRLVDRVLPEFVYRPLRAMGTWIALSRMPSQREHSRAYLRQVLGREPSSSDVFRHFFACEEALMLRLRVANGAEVPCDYAADAGDFRAWVASGGPMLIGTMHVGSSDLLGFQLGTLRQSTVYIVRERVGNSHDTDALAAHFGPKLRFIWSNERDDLLFQLKHAAETRGAIALQCDRIEHSARTEAFEFLGARRLFPFTIYHLALIFDLPVLLAVGVSAGGNRNRLHASPRFVRRPGESKAEALVRAREHFQAFLRQLEGLLREQPYLWFNFLPLNPIAEPSPAS